MRKFYTLFLLSVGCLFALGTQAQIIASDDASDNAYAGVWANNSNGGIGFNPWDITFGANTGVFTGDPSKDGMGTIGIGTNAFAIYATGDAYLNATRSFKNPLRVGDELSFYWAMNWDANGGTKGFDIKAGPTTVFNINNGANQNITSSAETALRQYGTKPMLVKLKRTATDLYSFSMTGRVDGENYSTTINTALPVDGISFYIGFQRDGDGKRNVYFNNFKITATASSVSDLKYAKGFNVYPNPVVKGTDLQIEFLNRAPGKYTVTLYNMAGVRVQQSVVGYGGGTTVQKINLSSGIMPGLYFAEITSGSSREQLKVLVQ